MLVDLVREHRLNPVAKPHRWEPRDRNAAVERGPFDPILRLIGQKAHTGYALDDDVLRTVGECHTPGLVETVFSSGTPDAYPPPARIRTERASETPDPRVPETFERVTHGTPFEPAVYARSSVTRTEGSSKPSNADEAVAHEVAVLPGCLTEVVLDAEQDPSQLIRSLAKYQPVSVAVICSVDAAGLPDTWRSTLDLAEQHPLREDDHDSLLVVVIDVSAALDIDDAVSIFDHETIDLRPGPLRRRFGSNGADPMAVRGRALAAHLWPLLRDLRESCEQHDQKVLLVTVDDRPHHALGPLQKSHRFRDARFRSHIGQAGTFWPHVRYRIGRDRTRRGQRTVTVIKDQVEGCTGRMLWPLSGT